MHLKPKKWKKRENVEKFSENLKISRIKQIQHYKFWRWFFHKINRNHEIKRKCHNSLPLTMHPSKIKRYKSINSNEFEENMNDELISKLFLLCSFFFCFPYILPLLPGRIHRNTGSDICCRLCGPRSYRWGPNRIT